MDRGWDVANGVAWKAQSQGKVVAASYLTSGLLYVKLRAKYLQNLTLLKRTSDF